GRALQGQHRGLHVLARLRAFRGARFELGERLAERRRTFLVDGPADAERGPLEVVIGPERLDPRLARARVAGVGEKTDELVARLFVELAVGVGLGHRLNDLIEQSLYTRTAHVAFRAALCILEKLNNSF